MTSASTSLGTLLADLRRQRGVSLATLAKVTYVSRGWINNVEAGRRWPSREWVEQAELALNSAGTLVPAWHTGDNERNNDASTRHLLTEAERESQLLIAIQPDAVDMDRLSESAARLGVAYLSNPAQPMLEQAKSLRTELVRRLTSGAIRPGELSDLYVALGRVSGVLAYAALDLGSPAGASTHGEAAWHMGDVAGNDQLRAWARGTQSLIARFEKNYKLAKTYVDDGLQFARSGTSEIRLLCGAAQCAANLGDEHAALAHIDAAQRAREDATTDDVDGLFGFSPAKQAYYSASSLMWLPNPRALQVAEKSATIAIRTWESEPVEQRSLDDEALAHVYLATARIKLGEIDGGMDAVRPIMELPEERQISWIRKRIGDLGQLLTDERFHKSALAANAREELLAFDSK